MSVDDLNESGEVRERATQPVDLVDDDDIDAPVAKVCQQSLQGGAVERAPGYPGVVVGLV